MKFNPKPVEFSEQNTSSRDASGVHRWAQSSRTISFIMLLLGWFTIPAEVLLRRDFGQRWLTAVNFYAGLFVLLIFAIAQYVWNWLWNAIANGIGRIFGYTPQDPSFVDNILDKSMGYVLIAYVLMGSYHLFKIWWRNRTNTALHSFDDGTSRLEPLAEVAMKILNGLAVPVVRFYARLLPEQQRQYKEIPLLVQDCTAFTSTVIEPLLLFALGYFTHGILCIWFFISAVALLIYNNWRESMRLSKVLDFRDSMIDAKAMTELKAKAEQTTASARIMHQAATTIKENPQLMAQVAGEYPDLMSIIEEMNEDKGHLAN